MLTADDLRDYPSLSPVPNAGQTPAGNHTSQSLLQPPNPSEALARAMDREAATLSALARAIREGGVDTAHLPHATRTLDAARLYLSSLPASCGYSAKP